MKSVNVKKKWLLAIGAIALIVMVGVGIWYWRDNIVTQWSLDQIRGMSKDWHKSGKYWETSQYNTPNLRPLQCI